MFLCISRFSCGEVARFNLNRKVLSWNHAILPWKPSEAYQNSSFGRSFVVVETFAAVYPWHGLEFAVDIPSHSSRGVAIGTGSLRHKQRIRFS